MVFSSKKLFVFGLGYSASRAAIAFAQLGYSISGTVRSREAALELSKWDSKFHCTTSDSHVQNVFLFDGEQWSDDNPQSLEDALAGVTHMLISVPTGRCEGQEDPVLAVLGDSILHTTKDSIQWVGYLSTIGVYGETHGVAVNESAPVGSSVKRSQMRIKAERLWLHSGLPTHVFRIAGIYGPGRGTITKVRSGTASRIHIPGRVFNRIHVDDIVQTVVASAARPNPGAVYNLCDDEPAPADQVTAYACELLGVKVPPSQSWEEAEKTMSAMAKTFYAESKVCVNTRIKEELGVQLLYPTYREGLLAQVLEEEKLQVNGEDLPVQKRLIVAVNIGSLRAEPYLDLRQISFRLSRSLGQPVVPCSFRFSNRVKTDELNGLEAKTFEMVLTEHLTAKGDDGSEVIILPLFFGKSSTLTEFLPKVMKKVWEAATPSPSVQFTVRLGGCLVDSMDTRIAQILLERIQSAVDLETEEDVTVIVVDHGTPNREVHEAREIVAQQLRSLLTTYQHVKLVATACMERRDGTEYDFNDPLLAVALDHYAVKKGIVVVAKLFLSNGRHAGEKGDLEEILDDVNAKHSTVDVRATEALGTHELLSEILLDRYRSVLSKDSVDYTLTSDA